jgi:hypothetical protein
MKVSPNTRQMTYLICECKNLVILYTVTTHLRNALLIIAALSSAKMSPKSMPTGFPPSLSLWGWCRRDYGDAGRAPPTSLASKREEQEVKSNKKFTLRYTAWRDCSMWSLETSTKHPIGVERGKTRIGRVRRMPPKVRLNRGRRGCLHNSSSNYRDRGSRWTSLSPYICKLHPSLRIGRAPVDML